MLTDRIHLSGPEGTEPEDYLSSSLGVIFTDDITNQHGDDEHAIIYSSPTYGDFNLSLADPEDGGNVRLFAHFLWNAGVQLAALVEDGAAWKPENASGEAGKGEEEKMFGKEGMWDVRGEKVLELGAGTGLAGLVAARAGAEEVAISDYPAEEVVANIRANVERNLAEDLRVAKGEGQLPICRVVGHEWGIVGEEIGKVEGKGDAKDGESQGEIDSPSDKQLSEENLFTISHPNYFTRLLVADCLWMPWQHVPLMKSIAYFLTPSGKAWVVAGFHTGWAKMAGFFDDKVLGEQGLVIEMIWERDAAGKEREWVPDRGLEDVTERKRWLVIAVLARSQAV